jgi:TPR repeat protein
LEGLDKGEAKCAYGVLDAVINVGSYRISDDEAISIFQAAYPTIKELAEQGDAEAMFIVGEGIRYGVVDDDEPYMLWLNEASRRGNTDAALELAELDSEECPTSLGSPQDAAQTHLQEERSGGADIILIDDKLLSNECTLISDADWLVLDDLGIEDFLADKMEEKRKMLYEHQGLDIEEDYKCLQEAE